jgi:uncharacterized protein (TIGR02231 family)
MPRIVRNEVIVAAFITLAAGSSGAAATPIASRPVTVTVFPGGAQVERSATVRIGKGHARVVLGGFPARMNDASVRIRLAGDAGPHLVGFAVEEVPVADVVSPEARALEAEEERLRDDDKVYEDARTVIADRRAFVLALRSTYQTRATANMALSPLDLGALAAVHAFASSRLALLAAEERGIDVARTKLAREIELVRRKLTEVASKREKQTKTVAVDVRAAQAGDLVLEVRYLVPGARWSSEYDATLDGERVRFVHYAVVTQETGEDWDDVALVLSSADTSGQVAVPVLAANYLSFAPPHRPRRYTYKRYRRGVYRGRGAKGGGAAKGDSAPAAAMPAPEPKPEEVRVVSVARATEFAATYSVEARVSIASDGQARRITVSTLPLEAEVTHESVPRLAAGALLVAKGRHRGAVPLLPGRVSLYLGKDFAGETHIPFTGTGGEVRLAFGRDDRLRVTRKREKRFVSTAGVFTKSHQIEYLFRFRLENLVGRPVKVALLDLVPSSMDERIEVSIDDATTPRSAPRPDDAKGTIRWDLSLAPQETRELVLAYRVKFPQTLAVTGLE